MSGTSETNFLLTVFVASLLSIIFFTLIKSSLHINLNILYFGLNKKIITQVILSYKKQKDRIRRVLKGEIIKFEIKRAKRSLWQNDTDTCLKASDMRLPVCVEGGGGGYLIKISS